MQAFYLKLFLLLSLLGFGSAGNPNCAPEVPDCIISDDPDSPNYADFVKPLPDTMTVICTGHKVDDEARIKTMARMMDWCYCGNELNPNGLEYAGFSVYEDGVDALQRNPSRTWACSKNKHQSCNDVDDWYNALGNVTQDCGVGWTGYFHDAQREMAWGFGTYQDKTFCNKVWNWEDTAPLKRATAGVNLKIRDVLVERAKDCLQLYRNG
ncbi:hypothetical protein F5883DRAFT_519283 [Diaporthe sp. PMI_573]|nr:hypothetical protein F5883DRAFT_519283 [Diaporthaceae sp. PMI_573]